MKAGKISPSFSEYKKMTTKLLQAVELVCKNYGQDQFIEQYRRLSLIIGKRVNLKLGKTKLIGIVKIIDDLGRLVIDTDNGTKIFSSEKVTRIQVI